MGRDSLTEPNGHLRFGIPMHHRKSFQMARRRSLSGDSIKRIRKELNLSQAAFAERLGAGSATTVCRWERKLNRPHHLFVERIKELQRGEA